MGDKKQEFLKVLSDPDLIAKEAFKSYKGRNYIDANLMVTWIVEEANKLLEVGK